MKWILVTEIIAFVLVASVIHNYVRDGIVSEWWGAAFLLGVAAFFAWVFKAR